MNSKTIFPVFVSLFISVCTFSQNRHVSDSSVNTCVDADSGYWFVDEPATFKDGDLASFNRYILKHMQYPSEAAEDGIYSRINVHFSIDKSGNICDVRVINNTHPALVKEVLRVFYSSPKWKPAKLDGKRVKQNFTMPISIHLQ